MRYLTILLGLLFALVTPAQLAFSPGTLANPVASPVAGSYGSTQNVTFTDPTSTATFICYTTDGSTPTGTTSSCGGSGTHYTTAIVVSTTTTIKAVAFQGYYRASGVFTGLYTIGAAAPTFQLSARCNQLSSPNTCALGSVTAGWTIHYAITLYNNTDVATITDNCNTGATSDTYTTDVGPTAFGTSGQLQSGHATVGATTASCSVIATVTGSTFSDIVLVAMSGSSGLENAAAVNNQSAPGSGTNAVTSNSLTTTNKDLCIGYSGDNGGQSGTYSAGTSTVAWNFGSGNAGAVRTSNEYFAQTSSGAITATFTYSGGAGTLSQTGISCFKP